MRKNEKSLDEKDKLILDNLMRNCRMSTKKLSQLTNLSHSTIIYRIQELEKREYISSYDIFPDITRFSNLYSSIYFVEISELEHTYHEYVKLFEKYPEVLSMGRCIGKFKIILLVLENPKRKIHSHLTTKHFNFQQINLKKIMPFSYSFYNTSLQKRTNFLLDNYTSSFTLNNTDKELISYLACGGGRDSLLNIARNVNINYEKILYSFKKLKKNNMFLLQVAQPSNTLFNLHIDYIIIHTTLDIKQVYKLVNKLNNVVYLATDEAGIFFFTLTSTSFTHYKNSIETLYEQFGACLDGFEIIHGKGWEFANRLQLDKLYHIDENNF